MPPSPQLRTKHVVALLCLLGCDSNATTPAIGTIALTLVAGDTQRAAIGGPVAIAPSVRVHGDDGIPIAGERVQFIVVEGGGTVTASAISSDAQGIATIGWTLGAAPGPNALVATVQGADPASAILFRATAYTPNAWSTVSPMPTERWGLGAGVVNDTLYAIGGSRFGACGLPNPPTCELEVLGTVEAYDPARNQWSSRAAMPTPREDFGIAVANGRIYVIGGHVAGSNALQTVEEYDPATNTWATRAPMPTPRFALEAAAVNGIIYAIGGGGPLPMGTVEAYDPVSNTWTPKAPMPTPREWFALAAANGRLYAVSGQGSNDVVYSLEVYDATSNTWATKASLAVRRSDPSAALANGMLYVMGGAYANIRPEVEAYDFTTDTWTFKAAMPAPRFAMAAGVIRGVVYTVGGGSAAAIEGTTQGYQP